MWKKFTSFYQILKEMHCTQKKIGSFFLPHGVGNLHSYFLGIHCMWHQGNHESEEKLTDFLAFNFTIKKQNKMCNKTF